MADWRNRIFQIEHKIKHQLNAKGVDNVEQLAQVLAAHDKNQNGTLERQEFNEFMNKLGVFLATQELRTVFDHFDLNKDGAISYAELISVLRNNMSDERILMVQQAWTHVAGKAESVAAAELEARFRDAHHPRTTSRDKQAASVKQEFCQGIAKYVQEGQVSKESFFNYYMDLNCCLPWERDTYFMQLVTESWGLTADKSAVPEAHLAQLESVIFEKIRQRTHGADDEGKTVKRFFKHFDLMGRSSLSAGEFKKAMEALGCTFKQNELDAVFAKYDKNQSGYLDFEEFAGMYALRGTGNNPNVNPVFGLTREAPHAVLEKIRTVLREKGIYGVRALVSMFRRFDTNKDSKLDRHEVQWVLKQNGQNFSPSEFERVFKFFDRNNDGSISINEFITGIRGEMNAARAAVVEDAWKRIAPKGEIPADDFAANYDVSSVASYASGRISKGEVLEELMDAVDFNQDGMISAEEFKDFYTNISPNFGDDEQFTKFVHKSWGLY
jgi:Ca2+-binding EF-hand superfamily protein